MVAIPLELYYCSAKAAFGTIVHCSFLHIVRYARLTSAVLALYSPNDHFPSLTLIFILHALHPFFGFMKSISMFNSTRIYLLGFGLLALTLLHITPIPSLTLILCTNIIYVPTYPRDCSYTRKAMFAYALHVHGPNAYPIPCCITLQF